VLGGPLGSVLLALVAVAPAAAAPLSVCTVSFHGPDEVRAFDEHLRPPSFETVRLGPATPDQRDWLAAACRAGVRCDVVIVSGEFGGRFFGDYGFSLGLQELEEASCDPRCAGIFRAPREVFLLACNTLATKDQDERTPREYLRVLTDHGFEQGEAERVVQMRYGPVGPSFRESLRRAFPGVPRLYGFASVAPRGATTSPMLERYFHVVGDYGAHLDRTRRAAERNAALQAAFAHTSLVQTTGLGADEPGAADRETVCRLHDERLDVRERLGTAVAVMARPDFLAFLPTMEAFFAHHPPEQFDDDERAVFATMREAGAARDEVLRLARDLDVSALKLEVAHFARHMDWLAADEFHRMAVDGARALLMRPLTSEIVDVECEIAKQEPVGGAIRSEELPGALFATAEGIRLVDCLQPADQRVSTRLATALEDPDSSTRLWAAYALSRRLPLPERVLMQLTSRLTDDSHEMRDRVRWILANERRLPDTVRGAVVSRDPELARRLWRRRR
jgi:hypothetical protein